jgi:PAS domain S-box-containing protein
VEAVVAGSRELAGLRIQIYSLGCLQGAPGEPEGPELPSGHGEGTEAIIGGGCLRGLMPPDPGLEDRAILAPSQCFHLVAPEAMVDALIAEGAYLLTPGWLAQWRQHLSAWGFDQQTAREFFQESTRELVLLDTGVNGESHGDLAAMGQYLGLPWRVIPVGLEVLRLSLEGLVQKLRRRSRSLPPPDHYFTDHLMVIDLMNDLLTAGGEKEAVERVKTLFGLLFAPGRLTYTPAGGNPGGPATPAGEDFAWTESGRGFVVPMRHQGQDMGSLTLDDLTFAEYKERYLALALPLARVCALAVSNARALEKSRLAERALRNMAGIVASSNDAIIGKTIDGIIVSWNRGAQRVFGHEEREVLGRPVSFLTPAGRPDQVACLLESIKQGQATDQVETVWVTKEGRPVDVSLQVSPIRDQSGRIVGASSIARDITQEKQKVEQERKSLEAQLMQAQKLESVGRLAGGVAHDFNNMLAVIQGYAELALEKTSPEEVLHQDLREIRQAAKRATALTRQLLAFARKQVLQKTDLDLNDLIQDFSRMIKRLIGEDIDIKMSLADDLPPIDADPAMMEQILLNLSVNARDAMPDGGTLAVETRQVHLDESYAQARFEVTPGDYVMLAVSDTGAGMDGETREKIFEPFFTTKGPAKGTGLGLATVYGIVKQHGGNIWVYSELDQGTTFKVYLPVAPEGAVAAAKPVEEVLGPVGGETILVVEDEPGLREFICMALTKLGYNVLCSGDPEEAQTLAVQFLGTIHMMLTDVVMPRMNGKALHQSLSGVRPEMKVLFMSGYTDNVIAHRGVLQDGVNFIQKPFSINQLAHKVGSILAERPDPD